MKLKDNVPVCGNLCYIILGMSLVVSQGWGVLLHFTCNNSKVRPGAARPGAHFIKLPGRDVCLVKSRAEQYIGENQLKQICTACHFGW